MNKLKFKGNASLEYYHVTYTELVSWSLVSSHNQPFFQTQAQIINYQNL